MSNFSFLNNEWNNFAEPAKEAEKNVFSAPVTCAFYARMTLEKMVNWLYENDSDLVKPYTTTLSALMFEQSFREIVPPSIYRELNYIRKEGNNAVHGKRVSSATALTAIKFLHRFSYWMARLYGENSPEIKEFDEKEIPEVKLKEKTQDEISQLQKNFDDQLDKLKSEQEKRLQAEEERELLRKRLEEIDRRKEKRKTIVIPPAPYSEEQTRKLFIDEMLREAGWNPVGQNVAEYEVRGMPRNVNQTGSGFADYVLWGDDGLPLAVVEAKHTMVDPFKGQHQSELYASCLQEMHGQRPVIYYTNGFDTWMWDDEFYPPREVQGIYTKDELHLLINRRIERKDIRKSKVNESIAGRYYQKEAILRICEALTDTEKGKLRGKKREALVVMATGAGKTRTASALVDVLTKGNWVKRVLFLADRRALVKQAKNAFKDYVPHLSAIDLTKESPDDTTRLVFSTYPTIMNKIDQSRNEDHRYYGVGHFDLIIVDEAHRSVYDKYRAIFQYFDAIRVGLTATPKDEGDRDTYELFGCEEHNPTAYYELDKAVADGFLNPPKGRPVDLGFMTRGIKYKDLSKSEKKQYEQTFRDENGNFPAQIDSTAINKWLYNANTIDKVINYLMENGIKVEGGDKVGKSIIFANSHKHAVEIQKRFDKQYPKLSGKFLQIIDNYDKYSLDTLEKFSEKDRLPQIAVSVDMLDTGIDIPEIVNLVFFKPVYSSSKYWQMIGRGTRLCPDFFGPGEDKEFFYIFDFCRNFEFFDEFPDGIERDSNKSLSQRIFEATILLSEELRGEAFNDDGHINLRIDYLNKSHSCVKSLWEQKSSFRIKPVLRYVDSFKERGAWDNLTKINVSDLFEYLGPLIEIDEKDEMAKRFDLLMLNLQLSLIQQTPDLPRYIGILRGTAESLMRITNIPAVKSKLPTITMVSALISDNSFWATSKNIKLLDEIRKDLRDLIMLIKKDSGKIFYTDFKDEIVNHGTVRELLPTFARMGNYIQRVEKFIRENKHHITISKLHTNQPITPGELKELEKILFDGTERGTKEDFIKELGTEQPLGFFIRSIIGLDISAAKVAFSTFLGKGNLRADQIRFIDSIIMHLTKNGIIDKRMLAEPPFTDINDQGIFGVFGEEEQDNIISIVERINRNAVA